MSGTRADTHQPASTPHTPAAQPTQVTEPKVSSPGNSTSAGVSLEKRGVGVVRGGVVPASSALDITASPPSALSTTITTKSSTPTVFPDTKRSITSRAAAYSATGKPNLPGYTAAPNALQALTNHPSSALATPPPQTIHPDSGSQQVSIHKAKYISSRLLRLPLNPWTCGTPRVMARHVAVAD